MSNISIVSKVFYLMNKHLPFKAFLLTQAVLLVISFAILGGLYYILNKDTKKPNWKLNYPVTTEPISLNLDINNPHDGLLTFDDIVVVSGKTAPNATVIISSANHYKALETNETGEFSLVYDLSSGPNNITVNVFDSFGDNKSETRSVFYSEEKL